MKVSVISECGYEEAMLGISLSYNSTPERSKQIAESLAFKGSGHGKFLESMIVYLDVTAPRYWWQEADTYRVGTTKQSESTMHTLSKRELTIDDFEGDACDVKYLVRLNRYRNGLVKKWAGYTLPVFKGLLPEGFLQRRIWMVSYKTLQGIYIQRYNHRLPQWRVFLDTVISHLEHPEFIRRKE
jgi:hypothetical protein